MLRKNKIKQGKETFPYKTIITMLEKRKFVYISKINDSVKKIYSE
jgi:hypothetical protein